MEGWHIPLNRRASGRSDNPLLIVDQAPAYGGSASATTNAARGRPEAEQNPAKEIFHLWGQYSDGEKSVDQLLKAISFINGPIVRQC